MFYRRGNNKKINRIHDRVFRLVYDGDISTFGQLLDKDKSFCIHQQDIERLLIEIHNSFHDNSENSLKSLIVRRESTLNLQSKLEIMIPLVNSVLKGRNSLRIQWRLIFAIYLPCSRLLRWVGYFICIIEFTPVFLMHVLMDVL